MFISVKELELRKLPLEEEFQPGQIDLGVELRQIGAVKVDGRAELVREHHGGHHSVEDIRLVGKLAGRVEVSCARCLEPVQIDVSRSFDLLYRPMESEKGSEEVSISEAETEIGYYTGDGMELEDALREQVLLEVPLKSVCRPDCKGLCVHCGKNLNREACGCEQKEADPRWGALKDLREKLK